MISAGSVPSTIEKLFRTGFTAWHGRKEKSLPFYPLEKLREVQNRRIRAIVAFAYETLPFCWGFMKKGFHICLDQVALRIVDFEGKALPPGRSGEIVVSNLINRASVLLNYRMGDLGQLSPQPCSCGRLLPTSMRQRGRTDDLIVLPDGEPVHESVVLSRLYSVAGVMQVQVIQKSFTSFTIKVVHGVNRGKQAIKTELAGVFLEIIGKADGISLDIEPVDFIPHEINGKFRSFFSCCPR
jgi:phenylacetate-CoA ligase